MSTPADTTPASNHPSTDQDTATDQDTRAGFGGPPPLRRPLHGRMLAGVAAGVADYLGVDEAIVRIVFAVATFLGGAGLLAYLAGWLLIPDEGSDQSLASDLVQSISQSLSARSN
jgi:phage shock protein PspC (stress-responsive transcriptional regulator)